MAVTTLTATPDIRWATPGVAAFAQWLRTHRGAVVLAGLMAGAMPLTSLIGEFAVAAELTPALALSGIARMSGLATVNWLGYLVTGYVFQRLNPSGWHAGAAALVLAACAAGASAALPYLNSWGNALAAVGPGLGTTLDTFITGMTMTPLFFAHLQRSRVHEEAAQRLGAAQRAQRETRQRLAQVRLQALQARIDPQLLFDMLDAVRRAYQVDPARAEQLLDELVAFLRAALPRLQHASSSVPREAELARACARLHALAAPSDAGMVLTVSADVMDARFPPGVLLPLLSDTLQGRAGACELSAARDAGACRLVLTLPARPSNGTLERVRGLLNDLYGTGAELTLADTGGASRATIKVPYEHA